MMRKYILLLIALISAHGLIRAQEIISISEAELLNGVRSNNLQIQKAEDATNLAKAELKGARALFLPNLEVSYTFMNTNSPMMAFGSKLNQKRIAQEDFMPDLLNHPSSITDFMTAVQLQQPLINIDGFYEKKAGNVKTQAMDLQKQRTEDYMEFETAKAYMMLQLAYKVKETLLEAEATTLANKKVMDDYYDNGLIQKSDVLYMEVRLTEIQNQLHYAESNILNASDYLFFLLNEDGKGKVFMPAGELALKAAPTVKNTELDESRSDLQAYHKSLEAYDYMVKSSNSKYLPRLNAFANYELHNKEIAKFKNDNYMIGLQLSWNVFDGLKGNSEKLKYKAERQKAQTEIKEYTQKSQLELNEAYRNLQVAENNVTLTQKALEQSEEAYRILKNRFNEGLEKSSDLLVSETTMSQKQLAYQQAIFEYNTALLYYQFLK